jgi:hypothetical protein
MNYHDIPKYESWTAWKTADGTWEVKLDDGRDGIQLHLSEDEDASEERIEEGKFYLDVEYQPCNLTWIREREGIDMGNSIVDADYVTLYSDGEKVEHQHNHIHLDRNVRNGKMVALTPV